MGKRKPHDELQIEHSLAYQKREWLFERVGWTVMALIVAAGLAGLLGRGPLSKSRASGPFESLVIEYDQFVRFSDATRLELTLAPASTGSNSVRVWLAQDYLDRIELVRILPEPARQELAVDGQVFVFALAQPSGPLRVTLCIKPDRPGKLTGRVRVEDNEPVSFDQLVYP